MTVSDLKQTPLHQWHLDHGARMVPFAGFAMPVQYEGVLAEHAAVRDHVGLFDITHMGETYVEGPEAGAWLSSLVTNNILKGDPGQVTYTAMCNEDGRTLDDMLIYRLADQRWLVVMNAANHDKIVAWMQAKRPAAGVEIDDASDRFGLIAVQGPDSRELLGRLQELAPLAERIGDLEFYTHFVHAGPGGEWIVSRTGYTGEHGYELYLPSAQMLPVWEELLERGADLDVRPIGLAARDTLRFEACYCLYGHELTEDWTPLEAGIGWAVKLKKKGGFIGRDVLAAQKEQGVPRKLIGLEVTDGPIAREGCDVYAGDRRVGHVTSGTFAPTLQQKLALALVETEFVDADLAVEVRGKRLNARHRDLPFLAARVKGEPRAERNLP
jgi:aminomethyltransferase